MKVQWTTNAINHLANIYEYIGLNSPTYAKRAVDKITPVPNKLPISPIQDIKCRNMMLTISGN